MSVLSQGPLLHRSGHAAPPRGAPLPSAPPASAPVASKSRSESLARPWSLMCPMCLAVVVSPRSGSARVASRLSTGVISASRLRPPPVLRGAWRIVILPLGPWALVFPLDVFSSLVRPAFNEGSDSMRKCGGFVFPLGSWPSPAPELGGAACLCPHACQPCSPRCVSAAPRSLCQHSFPEKQPGREPLESSFRSDARVLPPWVRRHPHG